MYVNPYDTDAHRLWVEEGNCPAIHRTKTWCGDRAGHSGDHHAPWQSPTGVVQDYLWWSDAEHFPAGHAGAPDSTAVRVSPRYVLDGWGNIWHRFSDVGYLRLAVTENPARTLEQIASETGRVTVLAVADPVDLLRERVADVEP